MIIFNGTDLEEIAPVMIEDIRVSPVQMNPVTRPRAIAPGSEFVRMRHGTRTVTVNFALPDDDRESRTEALQAIAEWAMTNGEKSLFLPQFGDRRFLTAICTAWPEPSYRQWWESKLRLVFTCSDNPYWNDADELSVRGGQSFSVASPIPPTARIEHTYASSAQNRAFQIGSRTMKFTTIPAGALVIDLNRQTAAVNGKSIMEFYQPTSSFIRIGTGTQNYSGDGTLYIRERWL